MKCMCAQTRPRFILSSEGVFGGMEFEPMLTPRKKSPLPKKSPEEDRTRDTVDSEPKHYQLSYSGPDLGLIPAFGVGSFSRSSHLSDLDTCQAPGVIGSALVLAGRCQNIVTGSDRKFDLHPLSQCGSTYNCLSRSVPEIR